MRFVFHVEHQKIKKFRQNVSHETFYRVKIDKRTNFLIDISVFYE